MKKLLLSTLISLVSLALLSQGCLPEGIEFTTQEQIDNFQTDNPGCTEIEGNVTISGDIENLNGLNVLNSIDGDFLISNTSLNTLEGLNNIEYIGGFLSIGSTNQYGYSGNPLLQNLTGLEGVTSIEGYLQICGNNTLTSLVGLENLTSIGGTLFIRANSTLNSLEGLAGVDFIGGYLLIGWRFGGNHSLISLTGLEGVTSIGGGLVIMENSSLTNLTGLEGMTSIGGYLWISANSSLTNMEGLEGVTSIGGYLWISSNDALTSLEGIENIDSGSIEELRIIYNSELSTCAIQSVCYYLAATNGEVEIYDNAPGCNSVEEVEEACETVSIDELTKVENITTSPNPFTTSTTLSYKLKQPEKVSLCVYNHLGQLVYQTVENQPQGSQQLIWNAEGYAEGVYYYRLQVGESVANGKMVKVR